MPTARDRPDFLVIGAMKCGTTTLYHDLQAHPGIFLPDKESNLLFTSSPPDAYAKVLRKASPNQICGEVCPDYSKLPDLPDAVPAAKKLFTNSVPRIIYLIRNPLERTLSHHRFVSSRLDSRFPSMDTDINLCIRNHPELIHYSRYAMQIRPWLNAFGRDSILLILLEDFSRCRQTTLETVFDFCGIDKSQYQQDPKHIHNPSDSRPVLTPGWQRIIDTGLYRQCLRPLLPTSLREKIRTRVLPKPSTDWAPVTADTLHYIVDELREDQADLQTILNLDSLPWDLESTMEKLEQK